MIQKEIIDLISGRTKIMQRELIEKDVLLHRLLIELSSDKYFFENFAFKGGTCLMKCYLNYYRFSEDLDFTYINQTDFTNKSEKQIRKILSEKIDYTLKIIERVSKVMGLDFKPVKSNNRYVEFGASNKQATFKVWYTPDGLSQESFIKIQINFVENLHYPLVEREANNLFFGRYDNLSKDAFLLPPDSEWLLKIPKLKCYDIKEILIEKVRAILTRKGTKARDYIDVYMIEKKEKIDIRNFDKQIEDKIIFMLKREKYKKNLAGRKAEDFVFNRNEEQRILLIPLPKDFDNFFKKLQLFLGILIEKLNAK